MLEPLTCHLLNITAPVCTGINRLDAHIVVSALTGQLGGRQ